MLFENWPQQPDTQLHRHARGELLDVIENKQVQGNIVASAGRNPGLPEAGAGTTLFSKEGLAAGWPSFGIWLGAKRSRSISNTKNCGVAARQRTMTAQKFVITPPQKPDGEDYTPSKTTLVQDRQDGDTAKDDAGKNSVKTGVDDAEKDGQESADEVNAAAAKGDNEVVPDEVEPGTNAEVQTEESGDHPATGIDSAAAHLGAGASTATGADTSDVTEESDIETDTGELPTGDDHAHAAGEAVDGGAAKSNARTPTIQALGSFHGGMLPGRHCGPSGPMRVEILEIARIRRDVPMRAKSDSTVRKYAALAKDGAEFPRVLVFEEIDAATATPVWQLGDGQHRLAAYEELGWTHVNAEIRSGNLRDAKLAMASANIGGLALTIQQKRDVAAMMFYECPDWTSNSIATWTGLSPTFVGNERVKYEAEHGIKHDPDRVRVSTTGRKYKERVRKPAPVAIPKPSPADLMLGEASGISPSGDVDLIRPLPGGDEASEGRESRMAAPGDSMPRESAVPTPKQEALSGAANDEVEFDGDLGAGGVQDSSGGQTALSVPAGLVEVGGAGSGGVDVHDDSGRVRALADDGPRVRDRLPVPDWVISKIGNMFRTLRDDSVSRATVEDVISALIAQTWEVE